MILCDHVLLHGVCALVHTCSVCVVYVFRPLASVGAKAAACINNSLEGKP